MGRSLNEMSMARVVSGLMIYSPPQHRMYSRPLEMSLSTDTLNEIRSRSGDGMTFNRGVLTGLSGEVLRPQAQAGSEIIMPNEYGRSWSFYFLVEVISQMDGSRSMEIISGYTDSYDPSYTGKLDPNMRFYVNSRQEVRTSLNHGGFSRVVDDTVINRYDIQKHGRMELMTPEAITYGLAVDHTFGAADPNRNVINTMSTVNGRGKVYCRQHVQPTSYLLDTLSAYRDAVSEHMHNQLEGDVTTTFTEASTIMNRSDLDRSAYVRAIGLHSDVGRLDLTEFTYRQLQLMDPRIEDKIDLVMPRNYNDFKNPLDMTNDWRGATVQTCIAYSVAMVIGSIMTKLLLTEIQGVVLDTINVDVYTHEPIVAIANATPLRGLELTRTTVSILQRLLRDEVMNSVIGGFYKGDFRVTIDASFVAEAWITVELYGQQPEPFAMPLFADSRFTPLVSGDANRVRGIMEGIKSLLEYVVPVEFHGASLDAVLDGGHDFGHQQNWNATNDTFDDPVYEEYDDNHVSIGGASVLNRLDWG